MTEAIILGLLARTDPAVADSVHREEATWIAHRLRTFEVDTADTARAV